MKSNALVNKKFWDNHWNSFKPEVLKPKDFHKIFTSLFKKFLPYNRNFRCLEVGCVPGNLLIEFNKLFGYQIYGIDYSDKIDLFKKNMMINHIREYQVYKADILQFKSNIKFDVVASFGLIEHFKDPSPYIAKMVALTKEGGYLIIHLPNFKNLQYPIHLLSDRQLLEKHYLKYMDAGELEKLVTRICPIKTLYAGYYGIIQDFPYKKSFPYNFLNFLSHNFNIIANRLSLDTLFSNRWTSPDTVYIGRKF